MWEHAYVQKDKLELGGGGGGGVAFNICFYFLNV